MQKNKTYRNPCKNKGKWGEKDENCQNHWDLL
jgi:hypothetical protein